MEKLQRANLNNPKCNTGMRCVKGSDNWEDRIMIYSLIALQVILQRLASDKPLIVGQCKLTEAALATGTQVSLALPTDKEYNTWELLGIGDLFIGAFYSSGFIDIYRNEAYSKWNTDAPYIIEVTKKFPELADVPEKDEELYKELLRSSSEEKIPEIKYMIQDNKRSVINSGIPEAYNDLKEAIDNDLPWLNAANKMQSIGWRINKDVLKVLDRTMGDLKEEKVEIPTKGCAKKVKEALEKLKKKDTKVNRNRYNREVALWNDVVKALKINSKNAETIIIYKKAKLLSEMKQFYQYIELDYRGRAYYYEPALSYQGNDTARGLLEFTEGKPLGETGKKWLEIHTATCYNASYNIQGIPWWCSYDYAALLREQGLEDISVDKMTLEDRAMWTRVNMAKVRSHANALQDCEKPVLYLACCLEWEKYAEDPNYISHLPIPIDGSCNGYQHSGAIAKDKVTGSLVSLVDQDIQADLYLVIAKALVNKNPQFFNTRPTMEMKHIRKGIVKRAVMTRAYSAGIDTMAENMYKDCHTEGYTMQFNITMLDCLKLAADICELLSIVCPGATKTMKFLQDLAKFQLGDFKTYDPDGTEVSIGEKNKRHSALQSAKKTKDQSKIDTAAAVVQRMESRCVRGNGSKVINWRTPTGFQVRYHNYFQVKYKYNASIPGYTGGYGGRIKHVVLVDRGIPDTGGFQAGISPNFIHSMDAAHMAGVIWNWDRPFGAIHDSYSALACDVEDLAKLTREVFVDMYDNENSYKIIAEMILEGDQELDIDIPEVGQLEVRDVLRSKYFFS